MVFEKGGLLECRAYRGISKGEEVSERPKGILYAFALGMQLLWPARRAHGEGEETGEPLRTVLLPLPMRWMHVGALATRGRGNDGNNVPEMQEDFRRREHNAM